MRTAADWIETLGLERHPEGGYFLETYRSARAVDGSGRVASTAVYYLLPSGEVSRLHRLASDEVFHFYAGSPLDVHVFTPKGAYRVERIGGDRFQTVVPAGCWFGASVEAADSYALVGCTVAPGFEFEDFELGTRDTLLGLYPDHAALIERLTASG